MKVLLLMRNSEYYFSFEEHLEQTIPSLVNFTGLPHLSQSNMGKPGAV
jgi:hypothetical protein